MSHLLPDLLVIDDDPVQRSVVSRVGTQAGYAIATASSIREAEILLAEKRFSCVTLDLSLGEESGTKLLEMLKGTNCNLIVISGCEERLRNSATQLARSVGLSASQLSKPIDISRLRETFAACLQPPATQTRRSHGNINIEAASVQRAIVNGEIAPWYQPKVDLRTGIIVGCEALARWRHPQMGMISPGLFIPVAEDAGLMPLLTQRMLTVATRELHEVAQQDPNFAVAINVSASLLSSPSLLNYLDDALHSSNLKAKSVILEITESVAMYDAEKATDALMGLRIRGAGLSVDDFGTGYSSLRALARMPFNELKIDSQFVKESAINPDMLRLIRSMIVMAHEMGMKTVAEGIETADDLTRMQHCGCDTGQGFLFLPAVERNRFLTYVMHFAGSNVGIGKPSLSQAC